MTFPIDEACLPATLTASPMSDDEFVAFCEQYPDYFIEMTAEGEIIVMPPNYSMGGIMMEAERITAGPPVEGLTLDLTRVWDPLATS